MPELGKAANGEQTVEKEGEVGGGSMCKGTGARQSLVCLGSCRGVRGHSKEVRVENGKWEVAGDRSRARALVSMLKTMNFLPRSSLLQGMCQHPLFHIHIPLVLSHTYTLLSIGYFSS